MGTNAVGGMIVAGPEGFQKSQYRKFNIKSTELTPGDDYGMMKEVLRRRFARLAKEEEAGENPPRPDLVLIDGGAGQLAAATGGDGRPRRRRHRGGRRRQGAGPRRRARAVLHARQDALHARAEEPGALLPAAPARRGAPLRHRHPPRAPLDGDAQQPAGRDRRRRRRRASARCCTRSARRAASHARRSDDLAKVDGVSEALAQRIFDFFRKG